MYLNTYLSINTPTCISVSTGVMNDKVSHAVSNALTDVSVLNTARNTVTDISFQNAVSDVMQI